LRDDFAGVVGGESKDEKLVHQRKSRRGIARGGVDNVERLVRNRQLIGGFKRCIEHPGDAAKLAYHLWLVAHLGHKRQIGDRRAGSPVTDKGDLWAKLGEKIIVNARAGKRQHELNPGHQLRRVARTDSFDYIHQCPVSGGEVGCAGKIQRRVGWSSDERGLLKRWCWLMRFGECGDANIGHVGFAKGDAGAPSLHVGKLLDERVVGHGDEQRQAETTDELLDVDVGVEVAWFR